MSEALTPRRVPHEEPRASELDVRLEQVGAALNQMRQAAGSLHDLEGRLSAVTSECSEILGRWAQNDERHAAAVLELHGRLAEWNDIERRLLHESATRIHQFERSIQQEYRAALAKHEEPLKRLDADAARVAETCLSAVDEALKRFDRAESRLTSIEEFMRVRMEELAREVRAALADLREQRPQVADRQPWSLDNVVRLHNQLRNESQGGGEETRLAAAAAGSATGALAIAPAAPHTPDAPTPVATRPLPESAAATTFWRQPSFIALAVVLASVATLGFYVRSQVQDGFRQASARADAAEQQAARARTEAGREIAAFRQQAVDRVASAEEAARGAQRLGVILAASDLRRFDLTDDARSRRVGQVLWSRTEGVAFSAGRLAAPPAGRTYQLWLLTPDSATSAGLISVAADGRASAIFSPPASLPRPVVGCSLTSEPLGGSDRPSGSVYLQSLRPPSTAGTAQ